MNEAQEILVPPLGVCWKPNRLFDNDCEGCQYFEDCTHPKKGNWTKKKVVHK